MAVRDLLLYPHPMLKQWCHAVEFFDSRLLDLARDLRDTLAASPGVGLAAPQIGVPLRVILIDVSAKFPDRPPLLLVNPRLLDLEEFKIIREGCLSVPDFTANVRRADRVRVVARDEHGAEIDARASGLEAIAIQHENDHLDGILFLDRVACLKTDVFRRKVKAPRPSAQGPGPSDG